MQNPHMPPHYAFRSCGIPNRFSVKKWRARVIPKATQIYHFCDAATGMILVFMIFFSPWAFGTTESWSANIMNACGFFIGLAWLLKIVVREWVGYKPLRWDLPPGSWSNPGYSLVTGYKISKWVKFILGLLSLFIIAFHLVAVLNAAAVYFPEEYRFVYKTHIKWLPHSYDKNSSLNAFLRCVALVLSFWGISDWVMGMSKKEEQSYGRGNLYLPRYGLPERVRRVIWILATNGLLLAIEGAIQRALNSPKLLFMVTPTVHSFTEAVFGPFAYRSNAAQYLNLIWPVALGMWWVYHRIRGTYRTSHHYLLFAAAVMCAAVFITGSRGGFLVAVMILTTTLLVLGSSFVVLIIKKRISMYSGSLALWLIAGFVAAVCFIGGGLGWKVLWPRLLQIEDGFANRAEFTRLAKPLAHDFPLFGTGPGTFEHVFQFYRPSPDTYWPAQLHNDWLELRVTMGLVGIIPVVAGLILIFLRWFLPGPIRVGWRFVLFIWLALTGCIIHARFDFPFQIYSVLFVFVIWCAILNNLGRTSYRAICT